MRIEWPTIGMIALCYGMWLTAGLLLWPSYPVFALLLIGVSAALHSSLQHEALHGHPTSNGIVNEVLVGLLPLAPAYPFRRFKATHLRHHHDERLTDPYDDPETYYLAGRELNQLSPLMRKTLELNNTLVGRIILGPPLMVWAFFAGEIKLLYAGDKKVWFAWALHLPALALVAAIVGVVFGMPLWLYALFAGYLGMMIIAVRTYCEHQAARDVNHRTIIVERSWLSWLFLNNNLHLVHHKAPTLAWYKLPDLMRERREEWTAMNGGYVYANYGALFRHFAFKRKEPLLHPYFDGSAAGNTRAQPVSAASTAGASGS
jgi:fatty acid desaturase